MGNLFIIREVFSWVLPQMGYLFIIGEVSSWFWRWKTALQWCHWCVNANKLLSSSVKWNRKDFPFLVYPNESVIVCKSFPMLWTLKYKYYYIFTQYLLWITSYPDPKWALFSLSPWLTHWLGHFRFSARCVTPQALYYIINHLKFWLYSISVSPRVIISCPPLVNVSLSKIGRSEGSSSSVTYGTTIHVYIVSRIIITIPCVFMVERLSRVVWK